MVPRKNPKIDEIIRKHSVQIENQIQTSTIDNVNWSNEYIKFKQEMAPAVTRFEKLCRSLGNIIKLKIAEKDEKDVRKQLEIAHLDIEPWQAVGLSAMVFIAIFALGMLISVSVALLRGDFGSFPFLFFILMLILALFSFYFVKNYPTRLANKWRLKASSQMVPAILYIVIYMRHTANLEKAIAFASEHLQPPLSLDFKKIFYNVQIGKFSSIKESLDNYLEIWRDYSIEFIEAFHLIESSLFEPDNSQRIATLDKSLQVIFEGIYDKMLKFTHNIRSPIQNTYMLSIVLPILGIALLPLASALIGGLIKWHHVFILYTLVLPFITFFLMDKHLMMRPGGHGETSLLERNPLYPKYKSRRPYLIALAICLPLFILGTLPLIFQYTPFPELVGLQKDYTFSEIGLGFFGNEKLFDFKSTDTTTGPFGTGALLLGMLIPLSTALFFSIAFKAKTKEIIKERNKTKQLEKEFNNSLFQIGSRLGNGIPPELVFGKVAESSKGLATEDFFRRVNYNVQQMGMDVESAIFDKNRGALIYYPSDLIATSMKVLIESSKKGLKIAAMSLMSISQYIRNIQKITMRLKDMLAEIISDIKSNMTFLAPLLSGVVVGIAAMITAIFNKLNFSQIESSSAGFGNLGTILQIFELTKMIPPYYLQIIIGIYLIEIIFILTGTLVTINSGEDRLEKTNKIGKNLKRGIIFYFITALGSTIALFILTSIVLGGLG